MAPEADLPEPGPEDGNPFTIGQALKFLESVLFCCLATLVILWAIDRARGLGFEPFAVTVCEGEGCSILATENADGLWSVYLDALEQGGLDALEQGGLVVFSPIDTCRFAGELLRTHATDAEVEQILTVMQERGTITITRQDTSDAIISPGANNDGAWDIARDALRWHDARGCHRSRYGPVFWPLSITWMLLLGWRIFRGGREVLTDA